MATITELRPIKRRVLIMLDGRRFACVPQAWIGELEIKQFDEVDEGELESAVASRQFEGAYAYALDMLAAAMHTRKQVLAKLAERGCCALTLQMVGQRLQESGLINDAEFAKRRAEISNGHGKGKRAAISDMIQKGVDAQTAQQAIEDWDADAEQAAANEIALKFMRRRWDDDKRRAKNLTFAALQRRGYSSDIARAALDFAEKSLAAEADAE